MSFDEKIATMMQRIPKLKEHLETEEATKNALVMPFIAALGYDIFNPKEVIPEFTADVGTKKGEKVDYAISSTGRNPKDQARPNKRIHLTKNNCAIFTSDSHRYALINEGGHYKI